MSISPEKFREIVFQILFSNGVSMTPEEEMAKLLSKELLVSRKTVYEAQGKAKKILEKKDELDLMIERLADGYTIDGIHSIEKAILRLGLYELCHEEEVPPKVVISEGVRLIKKFGQSEAAPFINAILDRAYKERC
jgi:N utilization substance protein B